jgi:hypothetical protein
VFDTVGALGLPAEFTRSPKISTLFGFADKILPEHIERAYHAMALDEERADFVRRYPADGCLYNATMVVRLISPECDKVLSNARGQGQRTAPATG